VPTQGPRGIEFLDQADEQPGEPPPRRHRAWLFVGGVAVAIAAMIWALTRPVAHTPRVPKAAPTQGATSTSLAPEEQLCREEPNCRRTQTVPLVLRTVINRYLPGTESITVHSYLTRSLFDDATYLVARRVDVKVGRGAVAMFVRREAQPDLGLEPLIAAPADTQSVMVRGDPFGYVVDLQFVGPANASPPLATLRALATEPGLEAV
jgi:hypothetical protein